MNEDKNEWLLQHVRLTDLFKSIRKRRKPYSVGRDQYAAPHVFDRYDRPATWALPEELCIEIKDMLNKI